MPKSALVMLEQIAGEVEAAAGEAVRDQVMAGSQSLTSKTSPAEIALFVKAAIDRLDAVLPEATGREIMGNCGYHCTRVNYTAIQRGINRRLKHKSEEDFLTAEMRKPQAGTRLEREGQTLYQIYKPQAFTRPMRCFCGLMRGLPSDVQVSPTYCGCSHRFVKTYWEEVLGRQVQVELLESAISGGVECKFKIELG